MTSTEANEFFDARTEEEVGGSTDDTGHDVHRSSFQATPSTAQMRKKPRGECRVVVQYIVVIPPDDLKHYEKEHGRQYVDGVDFGRALLSWLSAEGKFVDQLLLDEVSQNIKVSVEK